MILRQKKLIPIVFLIVIFLSVNYIRFSFRSEWNREYNQKSYDFDNKTIETLEISSDTSSPLLWYSQTGYEVQTVAISGDGNYIVSGSKNSGKNLVAFYHKNDSEPLWTNNSLNGEVFSVDISSNGSYMVAGTGYGFGKDTRVYLFEKSSSSPIWSYELGDIVFSVAISSDGNYIAAGSKDDRVYLFHKSNSSPIWNYKAGDHISSVAISNDGNYIVAGSGDHKIYFFERSSSTPLWSHTIDYIPGNMGDVDSVSISSDGNYIAAGTQVYQGTSKVYLFHRSSSTPLWKFSAGDYISSVSISSDGTYIVAGSQDHNIYLFNRSSSTPLWIYTTEHSITSVSISANGNYIVSVGGWFGNSIYCFNRTGINPLWIYRTTNMIYSVDISSSGSNIVGGSVDENVYLFKTNGSQKHITLYTDAENPDTNAEFNLYWNTFFNPEYVWIYEYDKYITEINESVNLIDSGNIINDLNNSGNGLNNPYRITGLLNGTYYYKIKANNSIYGEIYSNCIKVNIYVVYNLLWSRHYGGSNTQGGKDLSIDSLGNVYQTGYIMDGPHGRNDGILIKSSNAGFQIWNKTFGGSNDDSGMGVCIDSNDFIYVVGTVDSYPLAQDKMILLKYDSSGNYLWNRSWDDVSRAFGRSITIDSEDNIYITGYAGDSATADIVTIKYSSIGTKLWQRTWGGSGYEGRYGLKLAVDSQDNLYIATQTNSFGAGDSDAVLIKYNKFGNLLWNKTWGGVSIDGAEAIIIDSYDYIYIAGYTDSFSTNEYRNLFIAKFNDSGNQIWNNTWTGIRSANCKDMIIDSNDNILLTGYTYDSMNQFVYLLIYNHNGKIVWNTTWGHEWAMMNEGWGVAVDSFDNIFISGYTDYYNGYTDEIFLLKYSQLLIPDPFTLYSDAGNPDIDGIFNLMWFESDKAEAYSIYVFDKYIIEINTSLTLLSYKTAVSPYQINVNNGIYYYVVVAHNDYGNSLSNCIKIVVQSSIINEPPIIVINSPTPSYIFSANAPDFNVRITDDNELSKMWYTIDNGLNNYTFVTNGSIYQPAWDLEPNGTVTIIFYANDTAGFISFLELTVRKDILAPEVSILDPPMHTVFETAPIYQITVLDGNLDKVWYTFDEEKKIFIDTEFTGIINQELWDNLPNGDVAIWFYANDTLGHLNYDVVFVVKDTPLTREPAIPGYNIFVLIGIISLTTIFVMKYKIKSNSIKQV